MSNAGRKKKYNETFPKKALELAERGLNDKEISEQLGISQTVFYEYRNKYPEFSEALKKGKQPIDNLVENALLKRALGYEIEEKTTEVKIGDDGKPIPASIKTTKKHISGDVTAQIFWLKNRKPNEWRDRQEIDAKITDKKIEKEYNMESIPDDLLFAVVDKIQDSKFAEILEEKGGSQ